MLDNRLAGIVLVIFILSCIYFFIRTYSESEFKSENAVSVKTTGIKGNISSPDTPQVNHESTERDGSKTMVMHMLEYAMDDGGVSHELEIQLLKLQIETLPKPVKGNKKAARELNADGLLSSKNNDFNNAVKMFEQAHELDKSDIEIISNLGFSYIKQGNLELAQQSIINALSMVPTRASAWADLGNVFAQKGDLNKAVACFSNTYRFSKDRKKTHQFMIKINETENVANVKQARAKIIFWAIKTYPDISTFNSFINETESQQTDEGEQAKQAIVQRINQSWISPVDVSQGLKCTIRVRLMSDGTVIDSEVITSSGNESFDRSAENAVYKASPLTVPTDNGLFSKEFSSFTITFSPE